jgi:transcriptional regulator with XRE-family HTH domain
VQTKVIDVHPLQSYLARHDITQAEFGKRIGLKQSTISDVLNGRNRFSPEAARRVEIITQGEVTLDQLLFGPKRYPKAA